MQGEYGARGLRVLGVTDASADEARAFVGEHALNYPVLADARASFERFGVDMIWGGVYFLVDPGGRIVADELPRVRERLAETLGNHRGP